MQNGILIRLAASVWLVCVLGCGEEQIKTVPVSGVVQLDGRPLTNAHVSFQPLASSDQPAPGSHGHTDAKGRYRLQVTVTRQSGALAGKHQVRITSRSATGSDDANLAVQDPVPARYRDGSLTFEVPAKGTDKADFELSSK